MIKLCDDIVRHSYYTLAHWGFAHEAERMPQSVLVTVFIC